MSLVYSPLCETSEAAYFAYCLANYGASVGKFGAVGGRPDGAGRDGGCTDAVVDVSMVGRDDLGAWAPWVALLRRVGGSIDVSDVGYDSVDSRSKESGDLGGFSNGVTGGSDSGCSGNIGHETSGSGVGDANRTSHEEVSVKGKHYLRNKAKRDRAKVMRKGVRDLKDVCPSLTGSVCTVDTRTAEEIEAVRTLAARRVVENKVAKRMAELKLVSLNNKDKTDAVLRLEAARMEQRINEAKAKSQASFKECDTSLKSLGSTGSAGEFALKQEVKRGRDNELRLKYSQQQLDLLAKYASPEVLQMVAALPPPVFEHDAEVFGECPEDYDDEQRMAYDIEMNSRAAGVIY